MSEAECVNVRAGLRKAKLLCSSSWETEVRNERERSSPVALKVTEGGVPGREQKLSEAQDRSVVERAAPCSPCAQCGADLHEQPWRTPQCSSGCGLRGVQPMDTPAEADLGWSCSLRRGARGGAGGLGELLPKGAVLEQCLKCGLHGIWYVRACGETLMGSGQEGQHPVGRTPHWSRGQRMTMKEQQRQSIMD